MAETPLVVDWPAEKRIDLGVGLAGASGSSGSSSTGLVIASVDCPHIRILKSCSAKSEYVFSPGQVARTTLHFDGADAIRANLPLHMGGVALASDSAIDVALAYVGRRTAQAPTVDRTELAGECTGATHFVRSAWIGAFRVASGSRGRAETFAELARLGSVDASSASTKRVLHEDGALESCESHDPSAKSPPSRCEVPLRIELGAITTMIPTTTATASTRTSPSPRTSTRKKQRTWYPQRGVGPSFAWVGGSKALVGLVWKRAEETVDVVALDRKTHDERWSSGPYPIRWSSPAAHLAVVGDRIIVSDDTGELHVLDATTGTEKRRAKVAGRIARMCAADDGTRRLMIVAARSAGAGEGSFLDIDSGAITAASGNASLGCRDREASSLDEKIGIKPNVSGFRAARTIAAHHDRRITFGTVRARAKLETFAIGWDPRTREVEWETPLAVPGDLPANAEDGGVVNVLVSEGRVIHVYERELGTRRHRLVSRAARTGVLLSSSDVPAGSDFALTSVTADEGEVFVVIGQEVHVLDLGAGTWRSLKEL